jgi:hypothetical protein
VLLFPETGCGDTARPPVERLHTMPHEVRSVNGPHWSTTRAHWSVAHAAFAASSIPAAVWQEMAAAGLLAEGVPLPS